MRLWKANMDKTDNNAKRHPHKPGENTQDLVVITDAMDKYILENILVQPNNYYTGKSFQAKFRPI